MSFLDYGDLADTCLRGLQVKVVMPQFGLCQRFLGLSCSSSIVDEVLVVLMPHKTKVDKVLQVSKLIVS